MNQKPITTADAKATRDEALATYRAAREAHLAIRHPLTRQDSPTATRDAFRAYDAYYAAFLAYAAARDASDRAAPAWAGVIDADAWLEELRGGAARDSSDRDADRDAAKNTKKQK